jgi:hypothetical protein
MLWALARGSGVMCVDRALAREVMI